MDKKLSLWSLVMCLSGKDYEVSQEHVLDSKPKILVTRMLKNL